MNKKGGEQLLSVKLNRERELGQRTSLRSDDDGERRRTHDIHVCKHAQSVILFVEERSEKGLTATAHLLDKSGADRT